MSRLIESHEWVLIYRLGSLLAQRTGPYVLRHQKPTGYPVRGGRFADELFDSELAKIQLLPGLASSDLKLSTPMFERSQDVFRSVCDLLNSLVKAEFSLVRPDGNPVEDIYPALEGLVRYLDRLDTKGSDEVFDLATGPRRKLFELPDDASLMIALERLKGWNDSISRLLFLSRDEASDAKPKSKGRPWENTQLRDRATDAFQVLFKEQKCQSRHEIKLRLSQGAENSLLDPTLHMWYFCSDLKRWQEVLYGLSQETNRVGQVASFHDVCEELMRDSDQNRALRLMIQNCRNSNNVEGIVWEQGHGSEIPMKSLDHLISDGAFKPLDLTYLRKKTSGKRIRRFSTVEKRKLAVKLGHSLMDFFDTSIDSENVYFAVTGGEYVQVSLPYLAFTTGIPTSTELREFRIGHPILLAFAKLLLEMDDGKKIRDKISSSYDDGINRKTWVRLLDAADDIEVERSGPYLEAVRGCLMVYHNIAQSLRHSESSGKAADLKIREQIYVEIVEKLERASEQSIPRSSNKRKCREDSPPRQEHAVVERPQAEYSTVSAHVGQNRPSHIDRTPPRKQPRKSVLSKSLAIREDERNQQDMKSQDRQTVERTSAGLFHDNTLVTYPDHICKSADDFLEKHRITYELVENKLNNKQPRPPRVKVAILDTGIDTGHLSFIAREEQIKEVRTWVNGLDGVEAWGAGDLSGHGTHIANLLMNMAPDSDIYIARIAEFTPIKASQIAKAINYAVVDWKVDIISMSFGFPGESGELSKAILEAHARNILMFAAASNDGAHGLLPAFPARLHEVFCIYASDGMGNSIRGNPTPCESEYNFCTLGEAVESAWPRKLSRNPWKVRKSGTSFSTPLAAGLAAFILFYARSKMSPEDAEKFKEYNKMKYMFKHMSSRRNGYDVLLSISNFFGEELKERAIQIKMESIVRGLPVR